MALFVFGAAGCGGDSPALPAIGDPPAREDTLSGWRRVAMDRVLDYRVWRGARAGYVALAARNGRVVYARTSGWADLEERVPMTLATRFQLASMTKPVTAVAAMILVQEGRLSLDDPVARYLPKFAQMQVVDRRLPEGRWTTRPLAEPIRVRHLLTFQSGIGGYAESEDPLDRAWRNPDIEAKGLGSLAERVALIPKLPLYEEPGTRWRYGWSLDVLARVVEVAAGVPYDGFLEERIFEPLRMHATSFPSAVPANARVARIYTHDAEADLVRETRFDDYYGLGWTPGGGGLVSTAPDFLRFALMLRGGGALEGVRILEPASVAEMTRLHVSSGVLEEMDLHGFGWGLGFSVVANPDTTPMPTHAGDYWWSGRFGTHFWVSPSQDSVVVVMQQTEPSPNSGDPLAGPILQLLATP